LRASLADFNKLMEGLDKRTLECIFQGESDGSMACAMMGQEKGLVLSMKAALSKTRWRRVHVEMKKMTEEGVPESSVKSAQESLQYKIQKLEDMGHIVVAGRGGPYVSGEGGWPWDRKEPKLDLKEWEVRVLEQVG
jgi:flagellar motor switch protein FliG